MKIALIGYGKMGKAVEAIATERGHVIVAKLGAKDELTATSLNRADVAVEFTRPSSVVENMKCCFQLGVPVVTGTTGWNDQLAEVSDYCRQMNGGLLHASNFSIGVNLFFEINRLAARMMNKVDNYRVSMEETHHTEKLDSPSGTAITLADGITEETDSINGWKEGANDDPELMTITAHRIAGVTGTHAIQYSSDVDQITLEHKAFNRTGFALGAVVAAEWMVNKHGVFTMKDLIKA